MIHETKPGSFTVDGHPGEDQLLLALERELSVEDSVRVEQHLGNCWSCRARSDEMQRGILAFVEYREKRYLPSLPLPPDSTSGFRDRLRSLLGEKSPGDLPGRIWRKLVAFFALAPQVKWVSAVATVMAAVIFWLQVLVNPGAVSANELLARAVAAQNPPVEKDAELRTVHQKVEIRNGNQTVVREFQWKMGGPALQTRWDPPPDLLAWNAPLTAEGFAAWRNSLTRKKDNVRRAGSLLTLDTRTAQDRIIEASITVRAGDFHPIGQHLRFADGRQLDLTEVAFQIGEEPRPEPAPLPQINAPRKDSKPAPPAPQLDLDEAELQLRYTLFSNQWDLGEDLVIGRASGHVTLSGTVSSREREEAMRALFSASPGIQLAVNLPASGGGQAANPANAPPARDPALAPSPLLGDVLERAFASREERLAFVDRCLASSDAALSHAWALRRLAERYSEPQEQLLKPESRAKLREMLRAHLEELGRASGDLQPLLELTPASPTVAPAVPADWRAGALALFAAAQQQDRMVALLVAGSQTGGQDLASAAAELRSAHRAVHELLGRLNGMAGAPTEK